MSWLTRLANAFRPDRATADLDDELQFHLDARIDEGIATGMSRREAERAARLRFGGPLQLRETSRDIQSAPWLESILADARFGLRMLANHRAASLAAVASLALAIGACTAAFSLLDALVFRPLPLPSPDRLVNLARLMPAFLTPRNVATESTGFSYPQYELLRDTARATADLFAISLSGGFQSARFDDAGGAAENVRAESISGHGFEILGIQAAYGRLIQPEDDTRPVAVLSHAFWTRRFGASPSAIGRWVTLGARQFQIVGVTRAGFTGLQPGYLTDLWLPLADVTDPRVLASPDRSVAQLWGRLHPGADAAALAPPLEAVLTNFLRDRVYRTPPRNLSPAMLRQLIETPLLVRDASRGADSLFRLQFRQPLRIFALICVLLLLVACSNVGNLLIARAAARQSEMALRVSLGASRRRLMQQMLVEAAQLAAAATIVAVGVASFVAPAIAARLGASEFPAWLEVGMNPRSLAFAIAVSLLTTLFCGIVPAYRASLADPRRALQTAPRLRSLNWMLAAQVGFCVAVLFLSGLLLLSFRRLVATDLGFSHDHVILFDLAARPRTPELLDAVRHIPGVRSASLSSQRPMGGDRAWVLAPFVRFPGGDRENVRPFEVQVAPGFFQALEIRRISGRDFLPSETAESVVVNQAFVDQFLPGRDPLGQSFEKLSDDPDPIRHRIIGVVANARWNNVREPEHATMYTLLRDSGPAALIVRTAANAAELRPQVEAASAQVSATIRLSTQIDNLLVRERLLATLAGLFSAVALLLAGVGLYGVMHFAAVRRTREIGIRLALGARRSSVIRMMAARAAVPVCSGIALGIAGGIALARYLTSQLFGIEPTDPGAFAAPLASILAASLAAVLPPAIRAAGTDPLQSLREE